MKGTHFRQGFVAVFVDFIYKGQGNMINVKVWEGKNLILFHQSVCE